jgi:lysophospholipase L1-like esterase
MKTILCFGDSNTWGFDPDATASSPYPIRHPHDVRWTGVLARELGKEYRVIEEGQNGRTTVHEDQIAQHRNGRTYLPACLESHKPIDLVVLMLGTNDLKAMFNLPPGEIAAGAEALVKILLQSDAGPKASAPRVLIACPPAIGELKHSPDREEKFPDAAARSKRLPKYYEAIAALHGCAYLNSQDVAAPSPVDGIHLASGEHEKLGKAMAAAMKSALA